MPDNITAGIPYPTFQQPQQNALTSNPLQLLNNVLSLKKMQQDLAARQAIGNAYQKNIGADGSLDINGAFKMLRDDPDAAVAMPQASTDLLAQQGQDVSNKTVQFQLAAKQNQFLASVIGSLRPDASPNDIHNAVTTAIRNVPGLPADVAVGWMGGMPSDPKKRRQWVLDNQRIAIGPTGLAQPVPAAGGYEGGAAVPGTLGQFLQTNAGGGPAGGGPAGAGDVSRTPPLPGTVEQRKTDEEDIANFPARVNPLRQLVAIEQQLKDSGAPIGPGSAGRNKLEAFIATAFPSVVSQATKDKISLYDEFTKYATQNAAQLSQGLGPHTNEGLNTVIHGSPNTENVAAGDLAKVQLALESMRTANLANAHRKDENGNYIVPLNKVAGEKSRVGLDMDYRAFIPRSKKEWEELNKNMTGEERKRFNRSLQYGIKAKVLSPPGQ
jgi:hypothetical protein